MKRLYFLTVLIISALTAVFASPAEIDLSGYPEDFIIPIEIGRKYNVIRSAEATDLQITVHKRHNNDLLRVSWGKKKRQFAIENISQSVPYFIKKDGNIFLWFYVRAQSSPANSSLYFLSLGEKCTISDIESCQCGLIGTPKNVQSFSVARKLWLMGDVYSINDFRVGSNGRPTANVVGLRYSYAADEFTQQQFRLRRDVEVRVFESTESETGEIQFLKAGTTMRRLRVDNKFFCADMLLDDGRVARFEIGILFSEPESIRWVNGFDVRELFE